MPLTRKRATIWTTDDGKQFTDIGDAVEHDRWLQFHRIVTSQCFQGASADDVAEQLWEVRDDLRKALNYGVTQARKQSRPADVEVEAPK
jgi:hypothetical protein